MQQIKYKGFNINPGREESRSFKGWDPWARGIRWISLLFSETLFLALCAPGPILYSIWIWVGQHWGQASENVLPSLFQVKGLQGPSLAQNKGLLTGMIRPDSRRHLLPGTALISAWGWVRIWPRSSSLCKPLSSPCIQSTHTQNDYDMK